MGAIFRLISEKRVNQKLFQLALTGLKQLAGNDSYSSNTNFLKNSFSGEVKDLIKKIRNVLVSTQQMKEHEDDPEKFSDLQHTMAQSYSDSPEHRKTWLQEMARRHRENGNLIEAAMCYAHIAALVAQILNKNKERNDKN